jgi:hypothetical protein
MRVRTRYVALALVVAFFAVAAWVLWRQPVSGPATSEASAPHDSAIASGVPATSVPPIDPGPWQNLEWRSEDGAFGEPDVLRRIDGLVDAGELIVAWGRMPWPGRNQFNDMGAVFLSADGARWQEIAIDHGVNARNASTIGGVASGPLGYLAFGGVCCEPEGPAVWHSDDAQSWRRLELDGELSVSIDGVVAVDDGWVAHGVSPAGSTSEIWFSDDGGSWDRVLEVGVNPPFGGVADIDRAPNGLIAVGTIEGAGGSYDGAVWSSPDGRSWEQIGEVDPALVGDGEVQLGRVVGHAGGIFVTGIVGTAEERRRCEQAAGMLAGLGPPADPPPLPDGRSCMSGIEHQWASADGEHWQRIGPLPAEPVNPIEFRVVVAGGPGLVLLGESTRPASPDTTLFTSADGLSWTAGEPDGPFATDIAIGLLIRGRQIVAVTEAWDGAETSFRSWTAVAP